MTRADNVCDRSKYIMPNDAWHSLGLLYIIGLTRMSINIGFHLFYLPFKQSYESWGSMAPLIWTQLTDSEKCRPRSACMRCACLPFSQRTGHLCVELQDIKSKIIFSFFTFL